MPQIAQIGEIYASQFLWLAIFFGAIFVVIGLGMLPKIQSTVDARDARIAADLEVARTAREAADSLLQGCRPPRAPCAPPRGRRRSSRREHRPSTGSWEASQAR